MRSAIMFGLGLLLLPAAQAQGPPDLTAMLKKVSEIYRAATQYEFIGEFTCQPGSPRTAQPGHILVALRLPDRYRIAASNRCFGSRNDGMGESIIVFDGSSLWTYFRQENFYESVPATAMTSDPAGGLAGLKPDAVDRETMSAYRDAADSPADFIREEGGSYVVRIAPEDHSPVQTWWIDKATYHVVRIDDAESSIIFTTIKLNEPLPDDLFKFTPPPAAKKIRPDQ
jgi:outer membrane lipoprotein-sorting protein